MCGIAGMVSWRQSPAQELPALTAMQKSLARRGPDGAGRYLRAHAALLHTRLAVIDPEGGAQPMRYTAGEREWAIVYNGELYNAPELRKCLEKCGHHFVTHADTEVLLHACIQWGQDCLPRLNGIFAFAFWDEKEETLFLARDRMGVKPLFFHWKQEVMLFASEIKALLENPRVPSVIDREGVAELMLIGPGRTPGQGVFKDVEELLPGQCAVLSRAGLQKRAWWSLEDADNTDSFAQTVEKTRALLLDTIHRQLCSDVPVCTLLSGGLDSSILSAVADREFAAAGRQLHTFSVTYKDNAQYFQQSKFQPTSDENYIRVMDGVLAAKHHWVVLDSVDVARALYEAVEARDLPGMADVDSSLLLFCREIKKTATVALSGECADEIFGGYPWYRDPAVREKEGFPWAQSTGYRAGFLAPAWRDLDAFAYVDARYRATVADAPVLAGMPPLERRQKQMMLLNFRWFMQTLLDRKDRMSMYSGLEVRVPFCDHRIAQYLYTVPWAYKDWQGQEKGLLRAAVADLLPAPVLGRKKSPYPKTHHPAYLAKVRCMLRQVLEEPDAPLFQLADRNAVAGLLTAENRAQPWYGQLMTTPQTIAYFLQLNHWMEHYKVALRE